MKDCRGQKVCDPFEKNELGGGWSTRKTVTTTTRDGTVTVKVGKRCGICN